MMENIMSRVNQTGICESTKAFATKTMVTKDSQQIFLVFYHIHIQILFNIDKLKTAYVLQSAPKCNAMRNIKVYIHKGYNAMTEIRARLGFSRGPQSWLKSIRHTVPLGVQKLVTGMITSKVLYPLLNGAY